MIHVFVRCFAALSALLVVLTLMALSLGVVGIHYPEVVDTDPLIDPQKVVLFQPSSIALEDGRVLAVDQDIAMEIVQSAFEIDLEQDPADPKRYRMYTRHRRILCGTPYAQPIRLPMIADKIVLNSRVAIGTGTLQDE